MNGLPRFDGLSALTSLVGHIGRESTMLTRSSSQTTSTSFGSPQQGRPSSLSQSTQKSILEELKNRGGLGLVNITKLCESDPETFGQPRSTTRRAVQNKIQGYKNNPDHYHSQQLELLGEIFERWDPPPPTSEEEEPSKSPAAPRRTPVKAKKPSPSPSLASLFSNMSVNDYYGSIGHYDESHNVDLVEAWNNKGAFMFVTPAIEVGDNPTISTDVLTVMIEGVDPRFFGHAEFNPFKMTQVSAHQFVLERPSAGFDTLFPPPDDDDNKASFLSPAPPEFQVSHISQEQNEYKIARNKLVNAEGKRDLSHLRTKILYDVGRDKTLDFGLIDSNKRRGEVEYEFIGSMDTAVGVKFRIAFKPDQDDGRVLKTRKQSNGVKEKFAMFQKQQKSNGGFKVEY